MDNARLAINLHKLKLAKFNKSKNKKVHRKQKKPVLVELKNDSALDISMDSSMQSDTSKRQEITASETVI